MKEERARIISKEENYSGLFLESVQASGGENEGDFMQKVKTSFLAAGEEPGQFTKKKEGNSFLLHSKKGLIGLGICAFTMFSLNMFPSFAAPPAQEDDILVFSDAGEIISQDDQSVILFSEDVLAGDTVSRSQQVVDYAMQFIGRPYKYGGLSLLHGSDCSGFLVSIFGHFGISLPHSSAEIRSVGVNVESLENAVPGDVLAYSGHVGIYLGNGRMLSALNSRSGVTIQSATYKPIKSIRRLV